MTTVALVTGGTGFIGRPLLDRLLDMGWSVHCLCLPGTEGKVAGLVPRGLRIHPLTDDPAQWQSEVSAVKPDVVFHLASLFIAEHAAEDVEPLVRSNVLFGCLLLDAMSKSGCRCLVNIGTSWQHFMDAVYDPVCLYAATKQAFEDLAEFYVQGCGLDMVTLKLFDTYGPDDDRPKLLPALMSLRDNGGRLSLSGGEQLVDMVFVQDVVAAIITASQRLLTPAVTASDGGAGRSECFAVDSGERVSLRELVALVERLSGATIDVAWGARPYRAREVMRPWNRGERLPGWTPKVPLAEGLMATLQAAGCVTAKAPS
jgi:nucleoside-diphosphate-sugar epimerase